MKYSKMDYRQIQYAFENKLRRLTNNVGNFEHTSDSVKTFEVVQDGEVWYFKNYDWRFQHITITNNLDGVVSAYLPVDIHFYPWQKEFEQIAIQILKSEVKTFAAF